MPSAAANISMIALNAAWDRPFKKDIGERIGIDKERIDKKSGVGCGLREWGSKVKYDDIVTTTTTTTIIIIIIIIISQKNMNDLNGPMNNEKCAII